MPAGRPPFTPTDAQRDKVKALAACGVAQDDIAKLLGIVKHTLIKYFRAELDTAAIEANAMVAGKLYKLAMSGNLGAQIFWLKTRARWREKDDERGDGEAGPQKTVIIYHQPGSIPDDGAPEN